MRSTFQFYTCNCEQGRIAYVMRVLLLCRCTSLHFMSSACWSYEHVSRVSTTVKRRLVYFLLYDCDIRILAVNITYTDSVNWCWLF